MILGSAVPAFPLPAPVQPRARRAYLSLGAHGPLAAGGDARCSRLAPAPGGRGAEEFMNGEPGARGRQAREEGPLT